MVDGRIKDIQEKIDFILKACGPDKYGEVIDGLYEDLKALDDKLLRLYWDYGKEVIEKIKSGKITI